MLFLLAGGFALLWHSRPVPADAHASRLSAEHGITISFGPPNTFFVPPYGPADAAQGHGYEALSADPADAAYTLEGVDTALKQYPNGFVSKLIRAIFVCGALRMGGARAGGTAGQLWIILAAWPDSDAETIRATGYMGVHHELSSFVLRRDPNTLSEWQALEPAGAVFADEPGAALARVGEADPDPATGFLSAYGASNPENDFNTYAETMFAEPAKLASLATKHERVARKLHVVRAAYVAVDPAMDATFSAMGL
jgi:hypothetical protein